MGDARPLDATRVLTALPLAAVLAIAGCGAARSDPPLLVPWNRIRDITLGESKMRVQADYGSEGHGYHVLQRYGNTVQGTTGSTPAE